MEDEEILLVVNPICDYQLGELDNTPGVMINFIGETGQAVSLFIKHNTNIDPFYLCSEGAAVAHKYIENYGYEAAVEFVDALADEHVEEGITNDDLEKFLNEGKEE